MAYSTIHTSGSIGNYDIAPLTTVWTAAKGCPSIVQFGGDFDTSTSCYPPDYESVWYSYGFYSPGICPEGYTSGCTPTDSLEASETAAICVPTSYTCSSFLLHAFSVSGKKTLSVPAFQIRWAESDLNALETHPLTPGEASAASTAASKTAVTVTGSGPTSTDSESSSASSSSSGLPTVATPKKGPDPPIQYQPNTGMPELESSAHNVGFAGQAKHPQPHISNTIPELEQREKSPPTVANPPIYSPPNPHGVGGPYSPTSPPGSGMPMELPHDSTITELGVGVHQQPRPRYELGAYERPVAEMNGQFTQNGYHRHG
ncbi:transmembrane alpha-helix domain-containing [Fusarium albosuccineum]|uniref:Transmembrane alpha-helix domain-containing n=1 Tax=Fusarium albosuccineum TaxID=1237068 RepID=A0A8H4PDI6_9HYPO|nr:transmembrane alpha-helix domain-containing [Fusarium albosuccineum]